MQLVGHDSQQALFLEAYHQSRLHHGWLLAGGEGIGKSIFAKQVAAFLLHHSARTSSGGSVDAFDPEPEQQESLFGDEMPVMLSPDASAKAASLSVPDEDLLLSRIEQHAHPDVLFISSKTNNAANAADNAGAEEGKTSSVAGKEKGIISVEQSRKIIDFLRLTSGESDYRIVIIDSIDDMNQSAANAILKVLEEPPKNAILLLISHQPARLLPTIRSRCQQINFLPPSQLEFNKIMQQYQVDDSFELLYRMSEGSPGMALMLSKQGVFGYYRAILDIFRAFPSATLPEVHKQMKQLSGKESDAVWQIYCFSLLLFLRQLMHYGTGSGLYQPIFEEEKAIFSAMQARNPLDFWARLWQQISLLKQETERLHLAKGQAWLEMVQMVAAA